MTVQLLGLDIGERRTGVALSDPDGRVATPLVVLDAKGRHGADDAVARLVEEYEVGEVVVGLPTSMDGNEGPQAAAVRAVGGRLARRLPCPVSYWDERLSSAEASRVMRAAGADPRKGRGARDMVAAAIILQGFLDARANRASRDGGV